ncbi:DUF4097 family beta strand repeat-containing protein [Secundilactobacillus folii]|uniref:DUF4097 family beta strand repeat protein n=1 Tax=Secundilactobacillus folii TaxID=2678357 RepID=A0A7X2XUB8_9LACO|nr:DUF4097 family beta strand repeat-containing protein [Secundilactobacillus folii]MTV81753.1 DUF4097 family beta strand repeat protein [Secundilactobacillus folii]
MKKTFFAGLIIFVIGGVMLAIGLGKGGLRPIYWHDGLKIDDPVSQSQSISKVDTVNIKGQAFRDFGAVTIRRGSTARVVVHASQSAGIHTQVSGHQLTVTNHPYDHDFLGQFSTAHHSDAVVITVPKSTQIKRLNLSGAANVVADHLKFQRVTNSGDGNLRLVDASIAKKLVVAAHSYGDLTLEHANLGQGLNVDTEGNLTVRNSQINRANSHIQSGSGDVILDHNRWRDVKITNSEGDVSFKDQLVRRFFKVKTDEGDIDAKIPKKQSNTISTYSSDGDVNVYGISRYHYGRQAPARYQLTSSDGDITVTR